MNNPLPDVLAGARRALFARLVAIGFAQALVAMASARLTMHAFDLMVGTPAELLGRVVPLAAALAGCALALGWLRARERVDAERMGQNYARELRAVLFDVISALPLRTLQRRRRGSLMLRFVGDLKSVRQWLSLGLARLTVAAVSTVGALVGLAWVSAELAAIALSVLTAGAAVTLRLSMRARRSVQRARRRQARLAANLGEKLAAMTVVQLFGQVRRERLRLDRQGERLERAMVEQARAQAVLRSTCDVTAHLAAAAVLAAGVMRVAMGAATISEVAAAMTLIGLIMPALRDLGQVQALSAAAGVSRSRIASFLALPTLADSASPSISLIAVRGSVEFREVILADTLRGFTAMAAPGRVTAIFGPNGSGKSTLLALTARLLDPDGGAVLIDGQRLQDVSVASVRRAVGMVSGDLPLLRGTIDRNIRYRWPAAPVEEVQRVRELCRINEIVAALPDGERTVIQEGGGNLSLGQRQRIALARALLGDPAVLLLDEADVNLDPQANQLLDGILAGYQGTVLMVTHRVDRAARANALWLVDKGCLIAAGDPRRLLHQAALEAVEPEWNEREAA